MTVEPGQELLHFRLIESIGEGGMGAVWKAQDTTLDRKVAVKILPADFAVDTDRLARFHREAKLLAALNHPNIASIYGLHECVSDGAPVRFLSMELVEGDNLQQMLARGPLPLERALEIARQMVAGIESAHERGIVHRDLKPANVACTPSGEVKILDFGLAKAHDTSAEGSQEISGSSAPTATFAGSTMAGAIFGTAPYMSPEQARGKPTDKRTDVWAFGCVVYELLTGRQAFGGETVTDVLAAVVGSEPDWEALEATGAPPSLIRLLGRCLRKDRNKRLRDIGDVGLLLEEVAIGDDDPGATAPSLASPGPWKTISALLGVALLALVAVWWTGVGRQPAPSGPVVSAMTLLTDLPGKQEMPSLSPDGKQLLFVQEDGGDRDIFLQRVGGETLVNLTESFPGDDAQPSWSPDGALIAFVSDREGGGLFMMGATGESPRRITTLEEGAYHPAWSPDGTRLVVCDELVDDVFGRSSISGLTLVDVETGARTPLSTGDAVEGRWSPDGRFIAYWTAENGQRDIRVVEVSGDAAPVSITDDPATDWGPVWGPEGRWLYFVSDRGGSADLWRVRMDPGKGRPAGQPEPVTAGVAQVRSVSLSSDGQRVAVGIAETKDSILRVPFDPREVRVTGEPETVVVSGNGVAWIDLSRDEQWLAYRVKTPWEDLVATRVDGTERRRLTDDPARDRAPNWAPDGEWLVFFSNRAGDASDIWIVRRDGSGLRRLTALPEGVLFPMWSRDGSRIVATVQGIGLAFFDVDPNWLDGSFEIAPKETLSIEIEAAAAQTWSPDDRYLGGFMVVEGKGTWGFLDLETGEKFAVPGFRCGGFMGGVAGWLDERRLLCWGRGAESARLLDLETLEIRDVPELPGPGGIQVADEGRTVYVSLSEEEQDVWLLSLDASR